MNYLKKQLYPKHYTLFPNKGFTLIELLIVIAIIGILSAIVAFSLIGTQAKARDGQRKADLAKIQSALELYRSDNGSYPADSSGLLPTCGTSGTTFGTLASDNISCDKTYLQTIPKDPKDSSNYSYVDCSSNTQYSLRACLEQSNTGTASKCSGGGSFDGGACDPGNPFIVNNP